MQVGSKVACSMVFISTKSPGCNLDGGAGEGESNIFGMLWPNSKLSVYKYFSGSKDKIFSSVLKYLAWLLSIVFRCINGLQPNVKKKEGSLEYSLERSYMSHRLMVPLGLILNYSVICFEIQALCNAWNYSILPYAWIDT